MREVPLKHILEVTAKYKAGHQYFTAPTAIKARDILRIERVPEEVPDHQDGALTRIVTLNEQLMVTESYDAVLSQWHNVLVDSL